MEFKDLRALLGISLKVVSDETGIDKGTLSRIESKKRRPLGWHVVVLNDWAEKHRRSRRLPVDHRLTWVRMAARRQRPCSPTRRRALGAR